MKVIGLTGGIGSGKSSVLKVFESKGIPVFNADVEAKNILNQNTAIQSAIRKNFGSDLFKSGELDRKQLAAIVFSNPDQLAKLNALIHPLVGQRFEQFKKQQKAPYIIKEAAILFETGGWKNCDYTILVCAPIEQRIERVMQRDQTTREAVISRINNQWSDEKKIPLADFVIDNVDWEKTLQKIAEVHQVLSN